MPARHGAHGFERFIAEQVRSFQDRAAELRRYGAEEAAESQLRAAEELDAGFRRWWLTELSVIDAAAEAGYSPDGIRELVRDGKVPNARGNGRIGVRRCDLPRKPPAAAGDEIDQLARKLRLRDAA